MKVGGNSAEGGLLSGRAGNYVYVTTTPPSGTTDYVLVAGVDSNGDGNLDQNEIMDTSPWSYRVVPQSTYSASKTFLQTSNIISFSLAGNLLSAFANGVELYPPAFTSQSRLAALNINEPCLSHNVGAIFGAGGAAQIPLYTFPSTSAFAQDIRDSQTVAARIQDTISANLGAITSYFSDNPSEQSYTFDPVPLVDSSRRALGGSDCTYQDSTTAISTNFAINDGDTSDLFIALGSVNLSGMVSLKYARDPTGRPQYFGATLSNATVYDLYDFDYDTGFLPRQAAQVQAGYSSQSGGNIGGAVFKLVIVLDNPPGTLIQSQPAQSMSKINK